MSDSLYSGDKLSFDDKNFTKALVISCVYMIKNKYNGKIYIGSAIDFRRRIYGHRYALRTRTHNNSHLQRAFDKEPDCFDIYIMEIVTNKDDLIKTEQKYIDMYRSYDRNIGYNLFQFAGNALGHITTEETKQKIREKLTGKKRTVEQRKAFSEAMRGRLNSEEHKNNIRVGIRKYLSSIEGREQRSRTFKN